MLKELQKPKSPSDRTEKKIQKFISHGGTTAITAELVSLEDHRLTLRIPKWLLDRVDAKRKERVGSISRNLWILEQIEKSVK